MGSPALELDSGAHVRIREIDAVASGGMLADRLRETTLSQDSDGQPLELAAGDTLAHPVRGELAQRRVPRELVRCDDSSPESFVHRFFEVVGREPRREIGQRSCHPSHTYRPDTGDLSAGEV